MAMVRLVRGSVCLQVSAFAWDLVQDFAKQAGWRPAGVRSTAGPLSRSICGPGRTVSSADANHLATALEDVVNGRQGDSGELNLEAIALLVNFLRGGEFEIRSSAD